MNHATQPGRRAITVMRRLLTALPMLVLSIAAVHAADPPRLALVIGNSVYPSLPPLRACAASANVMSAALKRAGFDVSELFNVSNGRMGAAITDFGDMIAREPGTVAVAYVCGYALSFDGRVFLLPASANLERETDALTQGVVARLLVNTVVNSDAKAGLLLLDSAAQPGRTMPLPLESLVNPVSLGSKGFAAVDSATPPPDGATPMAAAAAAGLGQPEVEVGALLGNVRDALRGTPRITEVIYPPAGPSWLKGDPASSPSPPPDEPSPVPTPPIPPAAPPPLSATNAAPITAPSSPAPSQPAPSAAASRAGEPAVLNNADRRRLQLALQRLGYYSGKVDGLYGADTTAALRRYQHELNAEMTGRLTNEQAERLLVDGR